MKTDYQIHLEYISKYREGDVIYHATLPENVPSFLQNGFDPARIGSGGGCQGGAGLSGAWCAADAREWGERIYGWGTPIAVLRVSLPGVKLASHQQCDESFPAILQWGKDQGYVREDWEGLHSTEKLQALYPPGLLFSRPGWVLTGKYFLAQGYDGYCIGIEEVVIVNFDLLKPEAFSRV